MKEIRWHGRGGNGAFTAARLLGLAASIYGGCYGQAFPSFGPERRGAPVLGFTRIDDKVILDHSQVTDCDCVIVLDETLSETVDVTMGLKPEGVMVVNSAKGEAELLKLPGFSGVKRLAAIDATTLALEVLGSPIVNTAMLGAAVAAAELLPYDAVNRAIADLMPPPLVEKNQRVAKKAYDIVKNDVVKGWSK